MGLGFEPDFGRVTTVSLLYNGLTTVLYLTDLLLSTKSRFLQLFYQFVTKTPFLNSMVEGVSARFNPLLRRRREVSLLTNFCSLALICYHCLVDRTANCSAEFEQKQLADPLKCIYDDVYLVSKPVVISRWLSGRNLK